MTDIPNIVFFLIFILFLIFDLAFALESLNSLYFSST